MTLQPLILRKLKILGLICIFTVIVGMIYQLVDEGFIGSAGIMVGLFLGLGFGILELFLLKNLNLSLKTSPFYLLVIIKTVLYTSIIFILSNLLSLIYGYFEGKTLTEFYASLLNKDRFTQIFVALIIYMVIILFMQISRLLGEGVLIKFLYGKYHKPVEEERIFMFLDIKSSTTIAENIGHKKFYALMNTFFHEISEPVLMTKAEIYQYVGDEVVFTWKIKDGLENTNCLQIFFSIKNLIDKNREHYLSSYGLVPQFKAALHYGRVIVGQIGDLKREIVYNGDVLNTTSRIQELCKTYNNDLLISRNLLAKLKLSDSFQQEYIGSVHLRGKEKNIYLYGISQNVIEN